ncbi:uncharacterized protein B0I36DRAFT_9048 [Microdochium trichocladiopsis]|uniref:PRISE-like Rossmann-fold domain-containing protein n=1 Tax=Microdochium trichocladiopsis TaxID=1682393 RepID=A0A9P8YHG6_9PEZI|nr:uncharacterized protein B0I36DRAFT_9048 [Microdochium trichocladiopsis]KAH7040355.1 hypothetical protein B0I36DRAFT_9048 [Microdochium trichocladiopsis]
MWYSVVGGSLPGRGVTRPDSSRMLICRSVERPFFPLQILLALISPSVLKTLFFIWRNIRVRDLRGHQQTHLPLVHNEDIMGSVSVPQHGHHALVFGASGILGWAVVDQILKNYPEKGSYKKVTALSNRPLTLEDSLWAPQPKNGGAELSIVEGVDLTQGTVEDHTNILRRLVPDIESVTHVYWFAYKFDPDFPTENQINVDMLKRGLGAAVALAPRLQYVILPTGTKGYGIFLPEIPFERPFKEEVCDKPQPWHDILFYYGLHRELDRMQKGKAWRFAEVRCAVVIGFTPHSNTYNMWAHYIRFCSIYKYLHDNGHPAAESKEVPFPELPMACEGTYNDGGQDTFAKFSIHLCLNPDVAGNSELYNIANERVCHSMAYRWPIVARKFGLVGVPPVEPGHAHYRRTDVFLAEHADVAERLAKQHGVDLPGMDYVFEGDTMSGLMSLKHGLCLDKARSTGFTAEESFEVSFSNCLERYTKAGRVYTGLNPKDKTLKSVP